MTPTLQHFSDRLDRLPSSRFHIKVLIVAALSLFFDTLDTVVTGFVLTHLTKVWNFGPLGIGVVSAIGLAGYLVGSFLSGIVADKFGRKKTILYTLLLYSVFSASRGLSDNLVTFGILNFFTWIFVGAESSTVPVYLAELWPSRIRGKFNGWMMGFFALGVAASPVWALYLIPNVGWRWALFLTAPFALLAGLMRKGLPESPRWLANHGRFEEAERETSRIERAIEAEKGVALPPLREVGKTAPQLAASATKPGIRALLSARFAKITVMLWLAWLAQYGVLYTFLTVVPTLLAIDGYSIVKSFEFSVIIYSAFIPAYVLGGYLVDWIDRKYAALLAYACVALFGTMFGLSSSSTALMLFGGLTAFSLGIGATFIYTYTPELYPTEIRARGMGVCSAWGRVGGIILLLAFGVFKVLQGKLALFLISDILLLTAFVAILALGPRTKGKSLEAAAAQAS